MNEQKQNQNQSHLVREIFSRALSNVLVIAGTSDWFMALFSLVVISRSNYFGIGFSTVV